MAEYKILSLLNTIVQVTVYLKRNDRQFCNRMILDGEEFRRNSNKE